jgi:hypothetical protein
VNLEVFGQHFDTFGQESDLDIGRTGILFMSLELCAYCLLVDLAHALSDSFFYFYFAVSAGNVEIARGYVKQKSCYLIIFFRPPAAEYCACHPDIHIYLFLKRFFVLEFLFVADPFNKEYFHFPAIQVAVEVEQVYLYDRR